MIGDRRSVKRARAPPDRWLQIADHAPLFFTAPAAKSRAPSCRARRHNCRSSRRRNRSSAAGADTRSDRARDRGRSIARGPAAAACDCAATRVSPPRHVAHRAHEVVEQTAEHREPGGLDLDPAHRRVDRADRTLLIASNSAPAGMSRSAADRIRRAESRVPFQKKLRRLLHRRADGHGRRNSMRALPFRICIGARHAASRRRSLAGMRRALPRNRETQGGSHPRNRRADSKCRPPPRRERPADAAPTRRASATGESARSGPPLR